MNSGIYYVIFTTRSGIFGDGLAVFDNGNIHGGEIVIYIAGITQQKGIP